MAIIEALPQAVLARADVAAALALSDEAGWNQVGADWAVFIERGCALGLRDGDGRLVASAAALPYGADFGWVSMVLVTHAWRRQGLATRLMADCIDRLRAQGRTPLLDATPAGAEVYRRLGFVPLASIERWEGEGGGAAAPGAPLPVDGDRLIAADAAAFGAERRFLLDNFLARAGTMVLSRDDGFAVLRRGRRAMQIGPLVADRLDTARHLLDDAITASRGPVFLDLMDRWQALAPRLEACGFRRQRRYARMALGRAALPGDPARLVVAAGPEFG